VGGGRCCSVCPLPSFQQPLCYQSVTSMSSTRQNPTDDSERESGESQIPDNPYHTYSITADAFHNKAGVTTGTCAIKETGYFCGYRSKSAKILTGKIIKGEQDLS
jgi:hypothetical protein